MTTFTNKQYEAIRKIVEGTKEELEAKINAIKVLPIKEPQPKNSTRDLDQRLGELRAAIQHYETIDKGLWSKRGAWDDEPDRIDWQDKSTKYYCRIHRSESGYLCGYVLIDSTHPYYARETDALDIDHNPITWAGQIFSALFMDNGAPFWGFGFICNGYNPQYSYSTSPVDEYQDMNYVIDEVEKLARALKAREESLFHRQLKDLVTSAKYYVNKEHIVHVLETALKALGDKEDE